MNQNNTEFTKLNCKGNPLKTNKQICKEIPALSAASQLIHIKILMFTRCKIWPFI